MYPWMAQLTWSPQRFQILVTDAEGRRLLRAQFPKRSVQRPAVATLLTGIALYAGCPLSAVIDAGAGACRSPDVDACIAELECNARWWRCVSVPSPGARP